MKKKKVCQYCVNYIHVKDCPRCGRSCGCHGGKK